MILKNYLQIVVSQDGYRLTGEAQLRRQTAF